MPGPGMPAAKKLDSRILAILSRDIVAAKAHCHRSCYRLYTVDKNSQQEGDVGANDNDKERGSCQSVI